MVWYGMTDKMVKCEIQKKTEKNTRRKRKESEKVQFKVLEKSFKVKRLQMQKQTFKRIVRSFARFFCLCSASHKRNDSS